MKYSLDFSVKDRISVPNKKKNKSTKIKNSFSRNLYQNVFSLDIINDAKHNNAPRASMNTARITNPRTILIEAFAAPDKKINN